MFVFPWGLKLKLLLAAGLYGFFALVLTGLLTLIYRYQQSRGHRWGMRLAVGARRLVWAPPLILLVTLFVLKVYGRFVEPNWIQTHDVHFYSSKFSPYLEKKVMVHLTDLHINEFGSRERSLVDKVNALNPDVILISGDFIMDRQTDWPVVTAVLSLMKARQGIIAILGDSDWEAGGVSEAVRRLEGAGVTVLMHDSRVLDFGAAGRLNVVGISDRFADFVREGAREYADKAFAGIDPAAPTILLLHDPDQILSEAVAAYQPDLVLAGDTHGGQIGLSWAWPLLPYINRSAYMMGSFRVNGMDLYVNRGVGYKTLHFRLFCRPEIAVVRLHQAGGTS